MSAHPSPLSRAGRVLATAGAIAALVLGTALSASAVVATLESTAPPTISGTPNVGETLTAVPGSWSGRNELPLTYSWTVGDVTMLGTSASYVVQPADLGEPVFVTETAYADNEETQSRSSASVTIVAPTPPVSSITVASAPVLTGSAVAGSTLSVTPGTYSDPAAVITYQWGAGHPDDPIYGGGNGGQIEGATASTYVIQNLYIASFVQVDVTATSANGDSVTSTERTATVVTPAAPFATDAGLTAANQGGVTGSVTATTATITLPGNLPDGTEVFVYGFSTPTPLGFYRVVNGQIVVNFSALPAGAHKLLVVAADGTVLGWFGVSVLAATGANVNPIEAYAAGGALLVGGLLVGFGVYSRRRKASV